MRFIDAELEIIEFGIADIVTTSTPGHAGDGDLSGGKKEDTDVNDMFNQ